MCIYIYIYVCMAFIPCIVYMFPQRGLGRMSCCGTCGSPISPIYDTATLVLP